MKPADPGDQELELGTACYGNPLLLGRAVPVPRSPSARLAGGDLLALPPVSAGVRAFPRGRGTAWVWGSPGQSAARQRGARLLPGGSRRLRALRAGGRLRSACLHFPTPGGGFGGHSKPLLRLRGWNPPNGWACALGGRRRRTTNPRWPRAPGAGAAAYRPAALPIAVPRQ